MSTEIRPLHLFGRQALDELASRAQATIAPVLAQWWSVGHCVQVIGAVPWEPASQASPVRHLVRGDDGSWLGFLGTEQVWNKIGATWLECDVGGSGPLLQTLERAFCTAVYGCFKPASPVAAMAGDTWSQIPASALQLGAGTVIIEVDIDGVPLALVAPLSLWPDQHDWPEQKVSGLKLQARTPALADTLVSIEVKLPAVHMPAAELAELAAGDFINLEQDLRGAVRLIAGNANWELSGTLGQADGCRAVKIHQLAGAKS